MPELLLSCQELCKAFGSAPLFEGLSFGIFEGDHIGIVGPNGSGKSTLLNILAGLEPPSSGTWAARKRLRIGYVAQDPSFAPDATVAAVLREGVKDLGLDEGTVQLDETPGDGLEKVAIVAHASRGPRRGAVRRRGVLRPLGRAGGEGQGVTRRLGASVRRPAIRTGFSS